MDPLAEYLAGLHLIENYASDEEKWAGLLSDADAKPGAPEAIKGFLLALRDCVVAREGELNVPGFLAEELAKRIGLDPEVSR